jgi:hypothetical protein
MRKVGEYIDKYFFYIVSIALLIVLFIFFNFIIYFSITFQIIGITIDLTDFIIYIIIFSITFKAFRVSQQTMFHKALIDVQGDYGSPELGSAIRSLWDLYDKSLKEIGYVKKRSLTKTEMKRLRVFIQDKYEKIYKRMENEIDRMENWGKKLEVYKNSFDNQRRIISHYYSHLYDLINVGIIERKMIYSGWSKYQLDTVEFILIPLEEKLKDIIENKRPKIMGRKEVKEENLNKLEKLVEDFKNYKKLEEKNG